MAPTLISDKPVRTFKTVCQHCMCEVEFVPNDVMERTVRDYGGGSDTYEYIYCPNKKCEVPEVDCDGDVVSRHGKQIDVTGYLYKDRSRGIF